jgi:hypothetical protein
VLLDQLAATSETMSSEPSSGVPRKGGWRSGMNSLVGFTEAQHVAGGRTSARHTKTSKHMHAFQTCGTRPASFTRRAGRWRPWAAVHALAQGIPRHRHRDRVQVAGEVVLGSALPGRRCWPLVEDLAEVLDHELVAPEEVSDEAAPLCFLDRSLNTPHLAVQGVGSLCRYRCR